MTFISEAVSLTNHLVVIGIDGFLSSGNEQVDVGNSFKLLRASIKMQNERFCSLVQGP